LLNPKDYNCYAPGSVSNDQNCTYQLSDYTTHVFPKYRGETNCWLGTSGGFAAHVDCAVQNYWFYLLANGGTGLNNITVTGIGIEDASKVAYRNMVYYFTLGDDMIDMAQTSITSAQEIFGPCSNKTEQVINAWAAVGVDTPEQVEYLYTTINGPHYICSLTEGLWSADVSTCLSGVNTYEWTINGNYWSNEPSWYFTFDNEETTYFTIGLTVTNGELSDYDEIELMVYPCEGLRNQSTDELKLSVYPNPASANTTLEIIDPLFKETDNNEYIVELINSSGSIVFLKKVSEKRVNLNTGNYKPGQYSIIVRSGNKYGKSNLILN
jgi:hypothetical protein